MARTATVRASELQRASGKVLKRVVLGKEHLIVERGGYPVAVMMSYPEYEQLMRERALFAHRDLVRTLGAKAEQEGLGEGQLMQELDESKRIVYEQRYARAKR